MLLAACIPVVTGLLLFGSSLEDDAYITLGEARQLAVHGTLANYNGDHIEQSSSILHVLVLAALNGIARVPLVWATTIVGVVGAMLTVIVTARLAAQVRTGTSVIAALLAATSLPLVYWSLGGLETTLASFTLAASVSTAAAAIAAPRGSRLLLYAASAAAFTLVRPEGGIVLSLGLLAALAASRLGKRRHATTIGSRTALVLLGAPVATFVAVTAFRLWYFSAAFPEPVSAKTHGADVHGGIVYFLTTSDRVSTLAFGILGLLAIVGAFDARRRNSVAGLLVTATGATVLLFVLVSGGDWMKGGRFLATTVPLLAALAAVPLAQLGHRRAATLGLVALNCLGLVAFVHTDSEGTPLWATPEVPAAPVAASRRMSPAWPETRSRGVRRDEQTIPVLNATIAALHAAGRPQVTIGTGQAGVTMYYTFGRWGDGVRVIDRRSLVTDDFERCAGLGPKTVFGTQIHYVAWFANAKRCGVPEPDLIFDLGNAARTPGLGGYDIVSQQLGSLCTDPGTLHPHAVPNAQFIAIRHDLAAIPGVPMGLRTRGVCG